MTNVGQSIDADELQGTLFPGAGETPTHPVLVLHGAGGHGGYEEEFAKLLAAHGYTVFCPDYFAASEVGHTLARIPLSYFKNSAEYLLDLPDTAGTHVGVVGFSRGGEAALLAGAEFDNIGAVVAYVPSGYAFPAPTWMDGVEKEVAAWYRNGQPVEYIPVDDYVETDESGIDATIFETPVGSLSEEQVIESAEIAVENISGPVLLISGGRDCVWASSELAAVAFERLESHDHPWAYEHRIFPEAGHSIRVPYRNQAEDGDSIHRLGGTVGANRRAAAEAWYSTLQYLELGLH